MGGFALAHFARSPNTRLILQHLACMWVLTVIGVFLGTLLPPWIVLPLSIICFTLLIVTYFVRTIKLANAILYSIPFLMGIMLFWVTQFFIHFLGVVLVLSVFIATVIIFILLAVLGLTLKADISNWGTYLFVVLIVVVVFSFIGIFIPVESMFLLVLSAICVLLFAIYTVYDFNLIRHNHVREDEVIRMALGLFLNFINMFINLLEIAAYFKN